MVDYKMNAVLCIGHLCVFMILSFGALSAQNLLANGNFEDTNNCNKFGYGCAPEAWFRYPPIELPLYLRNLDLVYDGMKSEIIIVENQKFPGKLKLYLYSMLLCPLESGEEYSLSFYLNPTYDKNYKLEVVFTDRELIGRDIDKKDIPKGARDEIYYLIDNIRLSKTKSQASPDCDIDLRKNLLYSTNRRHTLDTVNLLHVEADLEKLSAEKELNEKEINYSIPSFAFGVDKFSIRDGYYEALDELVTMLNTYNIKSIEITGHSDNSGDTEYNQLLSEKRANSIYEYLSQYIHVEYFVSGKGETEPKFPNTSIRNRSLNRRVELKINNE